MTEVHLPRRGAMALLAACGAASLGAIGSAAQAQGSASAPEYPRDWDWLVGRWTVRHRRLRTRLAGSIEWDDFAGTCVNWQLLGGQGNVDDNVLELPSGTYRGVGVRAFDPSTRQWAIWWIDSRNPGRIDPPVYGRFANGVGVFIGDDTLNNRPINVRFRWSEMTQNTAHWDQAFSPDGGTTWETNWHMDFTRAG